MFNEFNDRDKKQAIDKLENEKGYLSLSDFHRVFLSNAYKYPMETLVEHNAEAESKTLSYLQKLLEEGKVKAGGLDVLSPDKDGITRFREFFGTPSDIITKIRKEWSQANQIAVESNNPSELSAFESFGVMITLPANKWPEM